MTKILSPKRWVGPPYYTSSLPFIARVEIDLLLILNKQSLQSKAWSSSNKYWTTLNVFFPKSTKNTKVESATRYPDHQILFQSQGSPLPIFHFPSPRHLPIPQLWDHLVFCASLRHTGPRPQETLPTVFNARKHSHPPTHPPQCPPSMLFPPLNALKPSLERPQQAQSAFGPDLGSFQALELLD